MALLKEAAVKVGLARLAEGRDKPMISVGRQPPPDLCCVGLVQQVVRREKEQLLGRRLRKAADLRKTEPRHAVTNLELIHRPHHPHASIEDVLPIDPRERVPGVAQ